MEDLALLGTKPNSIMPELPEVETITKVLTPIVSNRKIIGIDVLRSTTIIGNKEEFVSSLTGESFTSVSRIGKFLIFHLTNGKVMVSHLRMEGKFYEVDEKDKNTYYSRMVFHLDNNKKLCFDDSRCFGIIFASTEQEYKNTKDIAKLGPEPFDVNDVSFFIERNKKSNHEIKSVITDQSMIAGIGNIYADEILFACKIHPETPARLISKKQWEDIISNAKVILSNAIKAGGSTIHSFHPGKGIDGKFQVSLKAYGKVDEPCSNCGHPMRFIKVNGRGTTFCPICQQKISSKLKVAIFGPAGSGKSTVLNLFKEKGYDTISADEVVHKLYKNKQVANKIQEIFSLTKKDEIDIAELRNYLKDNPKDITRLERLIHPLVKRTVELFIKNSKSKIVAAEIPLLYQSHSEDLFDYIIGINSNKLIANLTNRDEKSASDIKKINSYKDFSDGFKKADVVIDNNTSISDLNKQVKNIINKLEDRLS